MQLQTQQTAVSTPSAPSPPPCATPLCPPHQAQLNFGAVQKRAGGRTKTVHRTHRCFPPIPGTPAPGALPPPRPMVGPRLPQRPSPRALLWKWGSRSNLQVFSVPTVQAFAEGSRRVRDTLTYSTCSMFYVVLWDRCRCCNEPKIHPSIFPSPEFSEVWFLPRVAQG